MDDNMKSAYRERHKQACVAAYNLLVKVWPPDRGVEYWENTAKLFAEVDNRHRDNPLVRSLLVGMYNCMGFTMDDSDLHDPASGAAHKVAFRVILDLVNDIVTGDKLAQAPEIIDLTRGAYPDNKLLHAMLDLLPQYLEAVQKELKTKGV